MCNFPETTRESLGAWEDNADFWDDYMGDESNFYHRDIVRPGTEKLLELAPGDFVLDAACGTGNFSQRMARQGARVVAFDYSPRMIAHARRRRADVLDRVEFLVCDATDEAALLGLRREIPFTKAVANMAVMDIADIVPLFRAVYALLAPGGRFVFSTHHPCFVRPDSPYLDACVHQGEAIPNQPVLQNYYHRPLGDLFACCFEAGFHLDGFLEVPCPDPGTPDILIARLRKCAATGADTPAAV